MDERPEIGEEKEDEDEIGEDGLEVQVRTRRSSVFFLGAGFWGFLGFIVYERSNAPRPFNLFRNRTEPSKHHQEPSQGSPGHLHPLVRAPSITWSLTKHHLGPSQASPGA